MAKKTKKRNGSPLYWSAETWAFLSLRLFLSLRFIIAGLGKFGAQRHPDGTLKDGFSEGTSFSNYYEGWIPGQTSWFESTILPGFLLSPYLYTIAYVEFILGALLFLGIKTKYVLALFGLTFVSLAFGLMLQGMHDGVTSIGIHLLVTAAALYFVRHNKLELMR